MAKYKVHVFTGSGNFDISSLSSSPFAPNNIEYLIVAGGGGGGSQSPDNRGAGGGGAGGLLYSNIDISSADTYVVEVGSGGTGSSTFPGTGTKGGNSSVFGFVALGGGGGSRSAGQPGGSGGGGGDGGGAGGTGTPEQGYGGGTGGVGPSSGAIGGGGGGSGGAGVNGTDQGQPAPIQAAAGLGGPGTSIDITGTNVVYSQGGRGGWSFPGAYTRYAGNVNSGGGGDGGVGPAHPQTPKSGLSGGSGVVIVRYKYIDGPTKPRVSRVISIESPSSIYESEAATITVNTGNASNGEIMYYTTSGNAEIYGNIEGSFEVNGNVGTFSIIAEASVLSGEIKTIDIDIRRGSNTGLILKSSNTIYVQDAPITGLNISGGTEIEIEI